MNTKKLAKIIILSLTAIILCCSCSKNAENSNGKLNVVATTTMLFDLSKEIGGEYVNASSLMGIGIDPHLYQASAGDLTKLQKADVVIYNGLHLEGKMGDVFESLKSQGKFSVCIEDALDKESLIKTSEVNNTYDPHIWYDVKHWKTASCYLAEKFSESDPKNAENYQKNLEIYLIKLDELDLYIKNRVEEISEKGRVVITAHDAFSYFGKAYGFTVLGLQGISTDAEASSADVSELADFIAENGVKAIFSESSVSPKNIEALKEAVIARGFSVKIGGELYSDSLGNPPHDSYIETFRANVDNIVNSLK